MDNHLFGYHRKMHISNDPNLHLKHPGVPDGSDGSDGTSYALTENFTLPVARATGRIAYVPPLLSGDVYASSERHVCYTLRRGCSYAKAGYTTPSDRRQAWEHLGAPATCLGAPRITVMYSVCILIYVSMYLCIYIATHLHTLYLDWLRSAEYILPVTLSTSVTPLIERVWDALGDGDWVNSEMHLEAVIERVWRCTWRLRSSELRDALAGRDRVSLEMHLEAMIVRTCRP